MFILNCPFCDGSLESEGEVELLRGAHVATRLLWNANLRELVVAEVYRCLGCGFLALFSVGDSGEPTPQAERISSDVKQCPECGVRNFRRKKCHACGCDLR